MPLDSKFSFEYGHAYPFGGLGILVSNWFVYYKGLNPSRLEFIYSHDMRYFSVNQWVVGERPKMENGSHIFSLLTQGQGWQKTIPTEFRWWTSFYCQMTPNVQLTMMSSLRSLVDVRWGFWLNWFVELLTRYDLDAFSLLVGIFLEWYRN